MYFQIDKSQQSTINATNAIKIVDKIAINAAVRTIIFRTDSMVNILSICERQIRFVY